MAEAARVPSFDAPVLDDPRASARQPEPAPQPSSVAAPVADGRVFVADTAKAGEGAVASPALARLAELVVHRGSEGPMTIAVLGGAGSGKSRALSQVVDDATALSRGSSGPQSPYLRGVVAVRIDADDLASDLAGDLAGDPGAVIAARLHEVLSAAAPDIARDAAEEANHSAVDPHARLTALSDSLDTARRRLDAERRARDEAESRRARLVETILYDSAGTRVDAYARANRSAIETALTAFGFTKEDPLATYKGLVHTLHDAGGPVARVFASLKSIWAYKGQAKLLVWAVLFLLAAWGLATLVGDPALLDTVRGQGETARLAADRIVANRSWLAFARHVFLAAAALCVVACAWRAVRFSRPLLRGASLIDDDLAVRRGELDNLVAHHAQRVEALAGETDTLSRRTIAAERRTVGAATPAPAFLTGTGTGPDRSRRLYMQTVAARLAKGGNDVPGRIVVALDELDTLSPATALATLDRATSMLRAPQFVLASAFDDARLVATLGLDARRSLERLVQVPFHVDRDGGSGWQDVVARLTTPRSSEPPRALDATQSSLDAPLSEQERDLLMRFAPLAGPSPRNVKRFCNLYRLGRADAGDVLVPFAFALALAIGGTPEERAAFDTSLRAGGAGAVRRDDVGSLRVAIEIAEAMLGRPMTVEEARRANTLAATWSFAGQA